MSIAKKSLVSSLGLLTALTFSVANAATENKKLIFVHGAHFTADSWQPVQHALPDNIESFALNLPGRHDSFKPAAVSLDISAAKLCSFMAQVSGNKVVVAHSQGGAIANASLALCPNEDITDIVYVTAVAPLHNTKVFSMLSKADDEYYYSGVQYNEAEDLLEIFDANKFAESFAQDANTSEQQWLTKHAVNEPGPVGASKLKLNQQRFDQINKHYVFAKQDRIISYQTQQAIAKSLSLKGSYQIDSGHLPMLTKTNEFADILLKITMK